MTKLQSAMLSVVFLCLVLAGVTNLLPVPLEVRRLSIGALSAVCFLASPVFLFFSGSGRRRK